jgi:hypothetical protein
MRSRTWRLVELRPELLAAVAAAVALGTDGAKNALRGSKIRVKLLIKSKIDMEFPVGNHSIVMSHCTPLTHAYL